MYADFQCVKCERIISWNKPYGKEMPEILKHECEHDGKKVMSEFKRYFGAMNTLVFDVAAGKTGNAKNGYTDTIGSYTPSSLTPMNKAWGKSGRSSWFGKDGRMD